MAASESRIPVGGASLYAREIGRGQAVIVLHGGPDFDHAYLLPDLDRLKDSYRLVYYDQRGRGRSAAGVRPEDVTLQSEVDDLDAVRRHFGLDSATLLGHSWGALLALEYALRYPTRVSHLILMNPAPVSVSDLAVMRKAYLEKLGADAELQKEIVASAAYQAGDPEAVTARYRIHFKPALKRPEDYEKLMAAMKAQFASQGKAGILEARAAEDRLYKDTWQLPGYDLLPRLRSLRIPTLVLTGDHDFIPVEVSEHIANAIPGAELVTLADCGHFAYLERPGEVRAALDAFFRRGGPDEAAIRALIDSYAKSIDAADTQLGSSVWANTADVSFIHPRGHERGWDAIKTQFYEKTMGQMFSERKLSVKDVRIHVAGESAWAEFYWDFAAKLRTDGSPVATHGRETQVYTKVGGSWRLVHVHYSGMPVIAERQGF
jgi:proline iminopeptidase